jgi:hypothetical protein
MWRPDIVVVEKFLNIMNEMDRGTDPAALIMVMNCQMCLMGSPRKFPLPHLAYSFFAALLFFSTLIPLSAIQPILYLESVRSECVLPDPIPIYSGSPTPPL